MPKKVANDFKKEKPSTAPTVETADKTTVIVSGSKQNITHKTKKRNWCFVCYPESLPIDWLDILRQSGLQVAISPLHDKDLEADEKTPKKPHYHVILVYGNATAYHIVKNLTDRLNATVPQSLESVRGYYRYLTHLDNPEKYQYEKSDIQCLNGFSIFDFCELTRAEVNQIKKKLVDLILSQNLVEYSDFIDFVIANLSDNEFDVASSHTYFFDKYLSSCRHKTNCQTDVPGLVAQAMKVSKENG